MRSVVDTKYLLPWEGMGAMANNNAVLNFHFFMKFSTYLSRICESWNNLLADKKCNLEVQL